MNRLAPLALAALLLAACSGGGTKPAGFIATSPPATPSPSPSISPAPTSTNVPATATNAPPTNTNAPAPPTATQPPAVITQAQSVATQAPAPTARPCDPHYPDFCIPPPPPDLTCAQVGRRRFRVVGPYPDPHGFDKDRDGIGCE